MDYERVQPFLYGYNEGINVEMNLERRRYVLLGWQQTRTTRKRNGPARRVYPKLQDYVVELVSS